MDFSETIAARDLILIELMKICEYLKVYIIFYHLGQSHLRMKF